MRKMSRRKSVIGKCHLCGDIARLTFEHVPPRAAYNNHRVLEADINKILHGDLRSELDNPSGRVVQGGVGKHTLCSSCNNNTGSWYGPAYVEFAKSLYTLMWRLPDGVPGAVMVPIRPVEILKQILAMFCSAGPPDFAEKNPDLVRFILNRDVGVLPDKFRVFMGIYDVQNSRAARSSGLSRLLNLDGEKGKIFSEICFPPFNLVLCIDSPPPDKRLFEITWFKNFTFGVETEVALHLFKLPVVSHLPADYRSSGQIWNKQTDP